MVVQEFLAYFKDDLPVSTFNHYNDYLKWRSEFYEKTLPFHQAAKQSYFDQENRLVDNGYSYPDSSLREFAYLGLFTNEDEIEFSNLIAKVTANLTKIDNGRDMQKALNYLYGMTDLILHEVEHGDQLSNALKDLRCKIEETADLDNHGTGEVVVRFIDLMV